MRRITDLTADEAAELRRKQDTRSPWQQGHDARQLVQEIARSIAAAAPEKQGSYTQRAGVPWVMIHELRDALAKLDALEAGARARLDSEVDQ